MIVVQGYRFEDNGFQQPKLQPIKYRIDESLSQILGHYNQIFRFLFQLVIEAEYGEGFEIFRPDGPLKVDVDFLNDRLQEGFLKWIRYAMKPDEAYGLIFSWDNVMMNLCMAASRVLKL
ncbi:uncharacterized protein LOC110864537 [Helianthus annuus]|uniref:uncharacterized protein LOC110864537 n=1 Tax=Helianthus annuus TaxID=4232 RepID=UPI000B8F189B|nr:uncharacterized protein LOC110864537 [Helianthus annuus]